MSMNLSQYYKFWRYVYNLSKGRLLGQEFPLEATLAITNRCNINCVYCYGNYPERSERDVPLKDILALIDEMYSMGLRFIHISGGEALIRPDVGEILRHVKKKNILLEVITNGVITTKHLPLLRETLDFICVSMDANEQITDANRGKGVYGKALETVRACRDAGIATRVNGVLSEKTVDTLEHLINLAAEERFLLSFNLPYGSLSEDRTKSMPFHDQKMRESLKLILDYKRRGYPVNFSEQAYDYVLHWPVPLQQNRLDAATVQRYGLKPVPCYYGRYICVIDANGDVYPCTHLWSGTDFKPKNYMRDGFRAAWEHLVSNRDCVACTDLSFTDHNMMFSLYPTTLLSQLRNVLRLNNGTR